MMKNTVEKKIGISGKEQGTTLVITMLTMLILMVIGAAALMTSSIELRVTGNERVQKQAFYASDAGLNFARMYPPSTNKSWWEINNLNEERTFTNETNLSGNTLRFTGSVTYIGTTNIPSGGQSGTKYKAFHYRILSTGQADNQARAQTEMRGYIIGLAP
jgi:hypothetical protein